jgi:hypothetical protein
MITIIVILAYVFNVFLNRWLNKIVYKKGIGDVLPWGWFASIACTIALICILVSNYFETKDNWFTGKYW